LKGLLEKKKEKEIGGQTEEGEEISYVNTRIRGRPSVGLRFQHLAGTVFSSFQASRVVKLCTGL
jgi:hypothetical protein